MQMCFAGLEKHLHNAVVVLEFGKTFAQCKCAFLAVSYASSIWVSEWGDQGGGREATLQPLDSNSHERTSACMRNDKSRPGEVY